MDPKHAPPSHVHKTKKLAQNGRAEKAAGEHVHLGKLNVSATMFSSLPTGVEAQGESKTRCTERLYHS